MTAPIGEARGADNVAIGTAAIVTGLGVLALAGWLFGISSLTTLLPGLASMKPNTALGLLLSGLALGLGIGRDGGLAERTGLAFAAAPGLLGLLTLLEYGFGADLHIDQLIWRDQFTPPEGLPGRMSAATSLCFVLFTVDRWILRSTVPALNTVFILTLFLGQVVCALALIGYCYQAPLLYHPVPAASMAVHTAAAFLLLFCGLMSRRPDLGWAALTGAPGAGGALFRWLSPVVLVLPVALGWLRLQGEIAGYYGMRTGLALLTSADILLLFLILTFAARRAERLDAERAASRASLTQAEADLIVRDQLYRTVVLSSNDPMITQTLDGTITSWNAAAERVFGYSAAEMIGQTTAILAVSEPINDITEVLDRVKSGEQTGAYETPRRCKDGSIVDISVTVSPIYDAEDELVGISRVARDITETKRAIQALDASEYKYRTTFDLAPVGIVHLAPDGRFLMVNEFFCTLIGYRPDELLATDIFAVTHPDDIAVTRRSVEQITASSRVTEGFTKRYVRKDGQEVWCEVTFTNQLDDIGNPERSIAIIQDITERRRGEETQRHLAAQLQQAQKMEAIGQLTGGMAHDFNNLLGVVLGNLEFLQEKFPPGSDGEQLTTNAIAATLQGTQLVRRLLAFARRQPLSPELTHLTAIIEGAGELLRRTLGEQITLNIRLADDLWPVLIDVAQLESAILNLAVNSRHAMPQGGLLMIEARNMSLDEGADQSNPEAIPGDYLVISVSDTGTGMPPEILAKVFEPFFTTKGADGTGLGLSMVHGFVKQSGGYTRIYSEPGRGTTVRIFLPRAGGSAPSAPAATEAPVIVSGNEMILVVEDNAALLRVTLKQLQGLGYRTLPANDALEAMTLIQEGVPFDLLFTDMVMPGGMNGKELADAARMLRPRLPILFTSGFTADAASATMTEKFGANLLTKPYRREDLAERIRAALDGTL